MKGLRNVVTLAVAAVLTVGCAKESEFQALRSDYMQLKAELQHWASDTTSDPSYVSVEEWQQWTKNVVCDIKSRNTPDTGSYSTGPGSTEQYCGTGDPNGDPEDPPPFGA